MVGVGHFLEWQEQALKQVRLGLVGVVGQSVLGGFVDEYKKRNWVLQVPKPVG